MAALAREILLVANCTNRKARAAGEPVRLREIARLGEGRSIVDRAREWCEALAAHAGPELPARDLYVGGHWSVVRDLSDRLPRSELFVLSAGYGLVSASEGLKSYSATFSRPGREDGDDALGDWVLAGGTRETLSAWWGALAAHRAGEGASPGATTLKDLARSRPDAALVVIASAPYLDAIYCDLEEAIGELATDSKGMRRCLIFCVGQTQAKSGALANYVVDAEARIEPVLARELGSPGKHSPGARQALGANMFRYLIGAATTGSGLEDLEIGAVKERFAELLADPRARLPKFDRKGDLDDDFVLGWIKSQLSGDSLPSASALLKEFRKERKCEQKRFHRLARTARESMHQGKMN